MATTNKCPGGLAALAIVNFVLVAFAVLSVAALAAVPFLPVNPNATAAQRAQIAALRDIGTTQFVLFVLLPSLVGTVLLLLSGIGYLKLKRFLGRTVGNVNAAFWIVATIPTMLWAPRVLGGGFDMGSVIKVVYPLLTLIVLNTTFKEDLVN